MTISSRTPEGEPSVCPICDTHLNVEPSLWFGDAPCPACGQLLWFTKRREGVFLFNSNDAENEQARIRQFFSARLGVSLARIPEDFWKQSIADWSVDSLDMVELVMLLEEEFEAR